MDICENKVYNIERTLERMVDIHQEILGVIKKPEDKLEKALQYGVLIVGIFGILHIIELVRQWIIGG